jgi:gluconokinase
MVPTSSSLLAIDIGTTSAKGLLVNPLGEVTASAQQFYETFFPQPGFAEQNPQTILDGVFDIVKKIAAQQTPVGICFSAAMHSLMAIDKEGKPLTGLMIWSDTRSTPQFHALHHQGKAQRLYEITGTPVHPMSPLCKLLWLKENQPDLFRSAFKFISIKEFVLFHLTGELAVDFSIASATGMFDLTTKTWSAEALTLLGVSEAQLSRPVSGQSCLFLKKEIAAELKLPNLPLIIGASDGCLAQSGSHAMGPHDLSVTLGTSGAVRTASRQRKIDPQGAVFNYLLDDETFICGGATNGGTALVQWFSENIDATAAGDLSDFVKQTINIAPGCEGLVMIPFLLGERAPIYQPEVRGAFLGVSIHHTHRHFQRAVLEGICFQLRWIAERVEEVCGASRRIFVSGGITRSPEWMQMLCDVMGRELILQEVHDASSMGAARFGFNTLKIQCDFTVKNSTAFHPRADLQPTYANAYRQYRQFCALISTPA